MNYFNTITKRKKFLRLQDTVCDIPEINEYSNCLYSYHSFFKRIGDFYNLCLSLKNTSNDKTIYEIYSSFNKQYKVLLIIKEYFKMTNYRKEYDKIKKCKNAIKILTLQKVIYKHIYNAIVNNNYNIYSN